MIEVKDGQLTSIRDLSNLIAPKSRPERLLAREEGTRMKWQTISRQNGRRQTEEAKVSIFMSIH